MSAAHSLTFSRREPKADFDLLDALMGELGVAFRSRAGQGAVVGIAGAHERTIIQETLQTSIM